MSTAKREKFVRLANKRVNEALKAIHSVGDLCNRANYDYSPEDVEKMLFSLEKEIRDCKKRFEIELNVDRWVQIAE